MSCRKFCLKTIAKIGPLQGLDYRKFRYLTYLRSTSVVYMISVKKIVIVYSECASYSGKRMPISVGKHVEVILAALLIHFLFSLHCALKSDAKFWVFEM